MNKEDYPIDWRKMGSYHVLLFFIIIFLSIPYLVMYPERINKEWIDFIFINGIAQVIFIPLSIILSLPKDWFALGESSE